MLWLKASELTEGPLSKEDLSNIASLTNLEKLELNGVGINNEAIETLSRLPKLRVLTARMGTVDRKALKTLKKMKTLESANLKNPLWLGRYERDQQKPGQDKAIVHK
jgi:Leucine-rich repeat (LRR) protein